MSPRARTRLVEFILGGTGFALLADAGGWKFALAFFLITCGANIRADRTKL